MKVAIATDNNQVSAHFGRCQHYTIFEVDGKEVKGKTVVDTPGHQPGMLPPFLSQKGVNIVIAGGMGPRAQNLFRQMNIEPITGVSGKVDEVIHAFLQDRLETGDSTCDQGEAHHQDCHHD
jgi:predicted Fe-Mo cluster-binding NifX family protein